MINKSILKMKKMSNLLLPYTLLLWQVPETRVEGEEQNSSLVGYKPIKNSPPTGGKQLLSWVQEKYLVIWCQSRLMAFVQPLPTASWTIPKPTNAEGKLLISPQHLPKGFPSLIFPLDFPQVHLLKATFPLPSYQSFSTHISAWSHLPQQGWSTKLVLRKWTDCLIAKCWKTLLAKPGQRNISAKWISVQTHWWDVCMPKIMILKAQSADSSLGSSPTTTQIPLRA